MELIILTLTRKGIVTFTLNNDSSQRRQEYSIPALVKGISAHDKMVGTV